MAYAVNGLPPVHPGELLADDLEALGLSARKFAKHIGVAPNGITTVLNGERSISAQMSIRLGKAFGSSPEYWLNLQTIYDLKTALASISKDVQAIEPLVQHAA